MPRRYARIIHAEAVMREGMQIEDANIPVEAQADLPDALSETSLENIVVGSFVSPKVKDVKDALEVTKEAAA